jgi:hypothetical protein
MTEIERMIIFIAVKERATLRSLAPQKQLSTDYADKPK